MNGQNNEDLLTQKQRKVGTKSQIEDPDKQWVEQAKLELPYRSHAYEKLMKKYQGLLLHICYKMLGNKSDAEDICQDVMLKVFHSLKNFEGRSSFKTWIARITTNTCINAKESLQRRHKLKQILSLEDPEQINTPCSIKHDLELALLQLKPKERQILTLRYSVNLKIDEIADICDQNLSATKMQLYRAQENLKQYMKAYESD